MNASASERPDRPLVPMVYEGEVLDPPRPSGNRDRDRLRQALWERRMRAMREGQIDNSQLWAGSSMYYYCKYCGLVAEVLPEGWWAEMPKTTCRDCMTLIELGWHDGQKPSFPRARS